MYFRYFQGTTVICRAIRTTFEGEMVAENYGPNFTQTPKNERQDILKRQYWFNCNCVACKEDWPLFSEMDESIMRFRCETKGCKNIIKVPTDTLKFMALCPVCNQHMNLLKGLKALQVYFYYFYSCFILYKYKNNIEKKSAHHNYSTEGNVL